MSSSSLRIGALALVLLPFLGGCSGLRPVYGDNGAIGRELAVSYAEPQSRLEQIIVQDLALRLGNSDAVGVPVVKITASNGARRLTRTSVVKAQTQYEMAVTASYTILQDGRVLAEGSRRATASYTTVGQVLADESASKDAMERAGHEVAETIRLSILGDLAATSRVPVAAQ